MDRKGSGSSDQVNLQQNRDSRQQHLHEDPGKVGWKSKRNDLNESIKTSKDR